MQKHWGNAASTATRQATQTTTKTAAKQSATKAADVAAQGQSAKPLTAIDKHYVERKLERGLTSQQVHQAATRPTKITKTKLDSKGLPSHKRIGSDGTVAVVNPETGKPVSTWKINPKRIPKQK